MEMGLILIMSILVFYGLDKSRPGFYCFFMLWGGLGLMGAPWWFGLILSTVITFVVRAACTNASQEQAGSDPSPHAKNFTSERIARQMAQRLFRGR